MKNPLLTIALLLTVATASGGEKAAVADLTKKIAPLSGATVLKLGFIGRGRSYPAELKAVWTLTRDPQAEACFLKLAEGKNACAALYGLMGLKLIKSKKFDATKAALVKRADKVKTTSGCYCTSHSVKQMAESVERAQIPKPPKS